MVKTLATITGICQRSRADRGLGKFHSGQKGMFDCTLSRGCGRGEDAGGSLELGHPMGLIREPYLASSGRSYTEVGSTRREAISYWSSPGHSGLVVPDGIV